MMMLVMIIATVMLLLVVSSAVMLFFVVVSFVRGRLVVPAHVQDHPRGVVPQDVQELPVEVEAILRRLLVPGGGRLLVLLVRPPW